MQSESATSRRASRHLLDRRTELHGKGILPRPHRRRVNTCTAQGQAKKEIHSPARKRTSRVLTKRRKRFCFTHLSKNQLDDVGIYGRIAPATEGMGIVCSTIRPGPYTTVWNSPSPPKKMFLAPETVFTSIVQVASIMAR